VARQVAVCGSGMCSAVEERAAREIGELLAGRGVVVICGGGTGVMAAAAAGARAGGGIVVGIRPGHDPADRPVDLSATVDTGLGQARNAIIVASADAVIAVGGSWGTLSEVALAARDGVPVVSLGGWQVVDAAGEPVPGVIAATDPATAVEHALAAISATASRR
jgi:uncharacterized protein (TIGR00725 family)